MSGVKSHRLSRRALLRGGLAASVVLGFDPSSRSWVTEARADLDTPLYTAVSEWLERDWPFPRVEYGTRD